MSHSHHCHRYHRPRRHRRLSPASPLAIFIGACVVVLFALTLASCVAGALVLR